MFDIGNIAKQNDKGKEMGSVEGGAGEQSRGGEGRRERKEVRIGDKWSEV